MLRKEALELLENNPQERRDGILRHFKNLLRVRKDLNNAIDDLFEDYPFLEEAGANGRTLAEKARKEFEVEQREVQLHRVK